MNIIQLEQNIQNLLMSYETDYLAESIATALIRNGVSHEQIILKSTGTHNRSYKKDVSKISRSVNDQINDDQYFITSSREGLYDTLPESIFHSFNSKKSTKANSEIIEEIKLHQEEEEKARLFFLPFEQEFFNIKRILFSIEDKFESITNASSLIEIYSNFYPILNELPLEKAYLFLRLSPIIHNIRDDFKKIETCFTMLLDIEVAISIQTNKIINENYIQSMIGTSTLGSNLIIGNYIEDGQADLFIEMTMVDNDYNNNYIFIENNTNLINKLCDYFIGAQYHISISFNIKSDQHNLAIKNCILGHNMHL